MIRRSPLWARVLLKPWWPKSFFVSRFPGLKDRFISKERAKTKIRWATKKYKKGDVRWWNWWEMMGNKNGGEGFFFLNWEWKRTSLPRWPIRDRWNTPLGSSPGSHETQFWKISVVMAALWFQLLQSSKNPMGFCCSSVMPTIFHWPPWTPEHAAWSWYRWRPGHLELGISEGASWRCIWQ